MTKIRGSEIKSGMSIRLIAPDGNFYRIHKIGESVEQTGPYKGSKWITFSITVDGSEIRTGVRPEEWIEIQ